MRETARTTKREQPKTEDVLKHKTIIQDGGVVEIGKRGVLIVADGNERKGYVLTSDDNGKATWQIGARTPAEPKNAIQFNNEDNVDGSKYFLFNAKTYSLTLGERVLDKVYGKGSFAIGEINEASGAGSFVHGHGSASIGNFSHSEGSQTSSIAPFSHSEGFKSVSRGEFSHAQGYCSETAGKGAHAEGFCTFSYGKFSHAEGYRTRSRGEFSHAEGRTAHACGAYSHAEGFETISKGVSSHAEGVKTQSNHKAAHSEGIHTIASGEGSHSQGHFTQANASASFSSGMGLNGIAIIANGVNSFIHSENTKKQIIGHGANADRSVILGGFDHNIEQGNENAVIIGGEKIKLHGNEYVNYTATDNLALFKKPVAGFDDNLLTWNPTSKKIGKISLLTSADARTKTIDEKLENVLSKVYTLNAYEYANNSNVEPKSLVGKKRYGLLSQEVEREFPLAVRDTIEYGDKLYKGIDDSAIIAILVQSIKELKNLINDQNIRIKELQAKVGI